MVSIVKYEIEVIPVQTKWTVVIHRVFLGFVIDTNFVSDCGMYFSCPCDALRYAMYDTLEAAGRVKDMLTILKNVRA